MNYFYDIDDKESAKFRMLIIKIFGIAGIVIGVFSSLFSILSSFPTGLIYLVLIPVFMYEFAAIPVGWWEMKNIAPDSFGFIPIVGYLIYFGIKFSVAYFVGLFVLPFEYKRLKKILND